MAFIYMVNIRGCHHEGGLLLLWDWPEGKPPLLRFAILIITTYDGNNCKLHWERLLSIS